MAFRSSMSMWRFRTFATLAAVLVFGCGGATATPAPTSALTPEPVASPSVEVHRITGTVDVHAYSKTSEADCENGRGFDDVRAGGDVVISDESGTIIGKGVLSPTPNGMRAYCGFKFEVPDVPQASFYSITIGGRDGPTRTDKELSAEDWHYELVLGG